ncbi:MAG: hypothetical protein AABY22_06840 [Nanoarchaeota archaeon]
MSSSLVELVKTRIDYYSRFFVLTELTKQLKFKYLSVRRLNPKKDKKYILARYYQGYSLDTLKNSLSRNNVLKDSSAKIYFDLATYKNNSNMTPIFSFDKKERSEQKKLFSGNPKDNNGEYLKLINSYDFVIDIDSKNLKTAWKDTKQIKEVFDKYKLPYSLRFSGSKGFHFVIDSKFINLPYNPIELPNIFGKVVQELGKEIFGIDKEDNPEGNIDFSIYDARRVLKLAYSLCNNMGEEYVCLPLNDKQFNNWKYEDMKLLRVMECIKISNRGLLERDFGLTESQLKSNFVKFIGDYYTDG